MVAGKCVVVAGYGYCGRGIAMRAKGLGARVIVTEIDPHKALEAYMDGYDVMPMEEAAPLGDFFVTATGCERVIRGEHMIKMKDGAILANAGHFDVEVDKNDLMKLAVSVKPRRYNIEGYYLEDGRVQNLLGEGRLVNLASGNGHPAEIMDMSFSIQALCLEFLAKNSGKLSAKVYEVPEEIDKTVAFMKLEAMGLKIDALDEMQKNYLSGM
jgi:adenosylhomocysteinase